jgi:hypothetical protein
MIDSFSFAEFSLLQLFLRRPCSNSLWPFQSSWLEFNIRGWRWETPCFS